MWLANHFPPLPFNYKERNLMFQVELSKEREELQEVELQNLQDRVKNLEETIVSKDQVSAVIFLL